MFVAPILILAIGLIITLFPNKVCELDHVIRKWRYRNATPTSTEVLFTRISGMIIIIVGVIMLFIRLNQ